MRNSASEIEDYSATMHSLGYPEIHSRDIPSLMRRAALEIEILRAELWRISRGPEPRRVS